MKKVIGYLPAIVRGGDFWYLRTLPIYRFCRSLEIVLRHEDLHKTEKEAREFFGKNFSNHMMSDAVRESSEHDALMSLIERVPFGSLISCVSIVEIASETIVAPSSLTDK